jgi:hypothetical protein
MIAAEPVIGQQAIIVIHGIEFGEDVGRQHGTRAGFRNRFSLGLAAIRSLQHNFRIPAMNDNFSRRYFHNPEWHGFK